MWEKKQPTHSTIFNVGINCVKFLRLSGDQQRLDGSTFVPYRHRGKKILKCFLMKELHFHDVVVDTKMAFNFRLKHSRNHRLSGSYFSFIPGSILKWNIYSVNKKFSNQASFLLPLSITTGNNCMLKQDLLFANEPFGKYFFDQDWMLGGDICLFCPLTH